LLHRPTAQENIALSEYAQVKPREVGPIRAKHGPSTNASLCSRGFGRAVFWPERSGPTPNKAVNHGTLCRPGESTCDLARSDLESPVKLRTVSASTWLPLPQASSRTSCWSEGAKTEHGVGCFQDWSFLHSGERTVPARGANAASQPRPQLSRITSHRIPRQGSRCHRRQSRRGGSSPTPGERSSSISAESMKSAR